MRLASLDMAEVTVDCGAFVTPVLPPGRPFGEIVASEEIGIAQPVIEQVYVP